MLIYLHMGRLPWQVCQLVTLTEMSYMVQGTIGTEKERRLKVREQKQKTPMSWFTDQVILITYTVC